MSSQETEQGRRGDGITLSDIIRGLQYCVNSSQEIVEHHHINMLGRFIDEHDRPRTRTIKFGDAAIDVPLMCLSGHSSLALDELSVKLNLMIRKTALKFDLDDPKTDDPAPANRDRGERSAEAKRRRETRVRSTRSSFGVDLANIQGQDRRHAQLDISMKFKAAEPPEMLSRIIDQLNNATSAYSTAEAKQE